MIVDYQYSNFTLGNSSDAIVLEYLGVVIQTIEYSGALFSTSGNSAELTKGGFQLTPQDRVFGFGDIGTPGAEGSEPRGADLAPSTFFSPNSVETC